MNRVDVVPWSMAPTSFGEVMATDAFLTSDLTPSRGFSALLCALLAAGVLCGVGAAGRLMDAATSAEAVACAAPCMRARGVLTRADC